MKKVTIYQIYDDVSENVISTFIAPNQIFAERVFVRFLTDDKHKDFINVGDFYLVPSECVDIISDYEDFSDLIDNSPELILRGSEVVGDSNDDKKIEEKS